MHARVVEGEEKRNYIIIKNSLMDFETKQQSLLYIVLVEDPRILDELLLIRRSKEVQKRKRCKKCVRCGIRTHAYE